jgi:CO/xanthine dehydrogenase FAD-binding subunit
VEVLQPTTLASALAAKAEHPDALPLAGGTDVMVELNFDRRRPERILDLTRIPQLASWERVDGRIRLGAAVTYTTIVEELAAPLPALAIAARTVGSPPIRNRGTIGGNLGSASPAGDCHPPLLAVRARVEVASVRGTRTLPVAALFTGVKRTSLAPDELIVAVDVPVATGPQQFAKVGPRNAMVIAVCSFALAIDPVGTGIGSAAPTPVTAPEAERFLEAVLRDGRPGEAEIERFGELVAAAARPIDDVRGSAAYRRHALAVLARRTLAWCLADGERRAA